MDTLLLSLFYNFVMTHLIKLFHEFQCCDIFQLSEVLNNLKNCELSLHFFGALYGKNKNKSINKKKKKGLNIGSLK